MVGVYWSEVFHRAFGQSAKHITDNVFQQFSAFPGRVAKNCSS